MSMSNIPGATGPQYHDQVVWTDKKRPFLNWPLSFTRYTLYPDRFMVDYGILFRRQTELRLYRIKDIGMIQGPFQRLVRVGNIRIITADASSPRYMLIGVKNPQEFLRMFSHLIECERSRVRVGMFESFDF